MTWIISKALMDVYENSHFSQEAEGESSEVKQSDGKQYAQLNVMPTPHPFWLRDKTMDILNHSRFTAMSVPLTDDLGEDVLTWFREGFHAKTSPQPGKVQESEESGQDYGEKWHALSVKYDRDTSGWKTVHSLFPEDLDWSCLTLPKWGMMQGGELWERTTQVDFTSVIESGSEDSWPTPKTRDWKDSAGASLDAVNPDGSHRDRRDRLMGAIIDRQNKKNTHYFFATPGTTGMSNGTGNCEKANQLHEQGVISDDERKSMRAGNGGQLNPDWVEWLMGWPIGWTTIGLLPELDRRDWSVDPADEPGDVPRVANGINNRVDRLRAIGNGQCPQALVLAWNELTKE